MSPAKQSPLLLSRALLFQALATALALAWVSAANLEFLSGDPLEYFRRMEAIFSGGAPYIDTAFEHFPLMLLPMGLAWIVGGFAGPLVFRVVWVVLTSWAILLTTWLLALNGRQRNEPLAWRWVAVSLPMLPLVIFRTEPWVVLPVVAGIGAILVGQPRRAGLLAVLGTAAKGWPALLNLALWRRGWKRAAVFSALASVALVSLVVRLPGFRTGRAFQGMHSESVGGAIWGLAGSVFPIDVLLESSAGAIYINAPPYLAVPGAIVAAAIVLLALQSWRKDSASPSMAGLAATGASASALLLVSPLQSSQFVYWLLPFVVVVGNRRARGMAFLAGLLATVSVVTFEALEGLNPIWFAVVLLRHCLIAAIGYQLVSSGTRQSNLYLNRPVDL